MRQEAIKRLQQPIPSSRQFEPALEILRFNPEKMFRIAEIMIDQSLKVTEGDRLLLRFHPGGSQLAQMIAYLAGERGAAILPRCEDPLVEAAMLAGISKNETTRIADELALGHNADIAWATKVAFVRSKDYPQAMDVVPPEVMQTYNKALETALRIRVDRRPWILIYLPTKAEAEIDQMPYEEYVDMFFRACDRPWSGIEAEQNILINEVLNPGKELILRADRDSNGKWQTELAMSIEGQTFANSTVDFNVPGSEIFSSPQRGTINGVLTLPYPVMFEGRIIPNLKLFFQDGKVVNHQVESDNEEDWKWVEIQLNTDDGAREVGEVAFGTNRVFNRPLLNGLFVEKVGGSFHIALGNAYKFKTYAGKPVKLDNGVESANHIDLTRLMLPNYGGGEVIVDSQVIQRDGDFLDSRLATLNSGIARLPSSSLAILSFPKF